MIIFLKLTINKIPESNFEIYFCKRSFITKQDPAYDFQNLAIQTEWLKDILMTLQLGDSVMNDLTVAN